jgi:hypothetical protein
VFSIELTPERRRGYKEYMKKQVFGVAVLLAFAFSTASLPAFAQAQQGNQGQDKSKAKPVKSEKSQPQGAKSQAKSEKKQGKQQGENGQGEMRFRGLDRNNDGIITRDEWRGEAENSFANHDWNGDGVLSGDEVRPGARRPATCLMTRLRTNAARIALPAWIATMTASSRAANGEATAVHSTAWTPTATAR